MIYLFYDFQNVLVPFHGLVNFFRVALDILSVQATKTPSWNEKVSKAFWRGRDARPERLRLIEMARDHPEMVDAGLTNFFFYRDQEVTHGPKTPSINFFDFFKYKYQLNIDGTVAGKLLTLMQLSRKK